MLNQQKGSNNQTMYPSENAQLSLPYQTQIQPQHMERDAMVKGEPLNKTKRPRRQEQTKIEIKDELNN